MKVKTRIIFLFTLTIYTSVSGQVESLRINVENIKNANGYVLVALSNSETTFLKKIYRGEKIKADTPAVTVTFVDLPMGEYAISVIHDENNNDELDYNFMGIPKEGFGFGNNAMGTFGPPSFDKAKIKWERKSMSVRVKLRHY